jgi:predicted PurR-regulated permease PerM
MVIFGGGGPKSMLVYGLVTMAILAFSYFVIIKPITNSTNDTVNNAFKQANQIEKQANKSINQGLNQANQAEKQANKQLKGASQ